MAGKSKAQKPVKGSAPADCGGIKPEKLLTPKDGGKDKTPKKK